VTTDKCCDFYDHLNQREAEQRDEIVRQCIEIGAKHRCGDSPAPVVSVPGDDDDPLELAYWRMDAMRKGYGEWKGHPQSERDAFKVTLAAQLAKVTAERDGLRDLLSKVVNCKRPYIAVKGDGVYFSDEVIAAAVIQPDVSA
jgi:hypothetical protein